MSPESHKEKELWGLLWRRSKRWLTVIVAGHIALLLTAAYDVALAITIFWSYWHSESSIAAWMLLGRSTSQAIGVTIVASTVATLNWMWLGNCIKPVVGEIIEKLSGKKFEPPEKVFLSEYLSLPVMSFIPWGGTFAAVTYVKLLNLKQLPSFLLITVGNIVQMITWGYGFHLIKKTWGKEYLLVAAVFILALTAVRGLRKLFKTARPKK